MRDLSRSWLTVLAALLALWLVLAFWPLSAVSRVLLSLCIVLIAGSLLWRQWRQSRRLNAESQQITDRHLPPEDFQGAVVLVCGDTDGIFPANTDFRETRQGGYLRVENAERLPLLAQHLAAMRPALVSQVSVLLAVMPEQHQEAAVFAQALRGWHRSIIQCRSWLNGVPPVWQVTWASCPDSGISDEPLWFTVTPDLPDIRVRQRGQVVRPVADWQREESAHSTAVLWLDSVLAFTLWHVTPLLTARQHELPPLRFCVAGVCLTAVSAQTDNLWQQQIAELTTLTPENVSASTLLPLPEVLLPYLPRRHGISRRMQEVRLAAGVCFLFLSLAMFASFINNQRLARSISDHLAQYHHLSGHPPAPKVQAQQRLRADDRLLDDWLRRSEPLRYGLGLYQGMRLIPPVEAAMSDWAPPPPPPVVIKNVTHTTGPQTVRLDSMSLFDTGKWQLKAGSTKVLVNALVNIKAKAGWLIVVSGHTDSTGNAQANQALSLKRAESVRDWMRDTGDVPESCFAVQGYGATRPLATNDTAQGRAANRRVEISLVPQADACQVPDTEAGDPVNQK